MDINDLHRLQQIQIGILKEVVKFCDEYNIKYYLMYGTLLGAIRHNGIIPWDNDIDICMDRENYEKLWNLSDKLPDDLQILLIGSGNIKDYGLSRVIKKGSLVYSRAHDKNKGFPIHIDIYVLDYAKKKRGLNEKLARSFCRFLQIGKLSKYEKSWLYDRFSENGVKKVIVIFSDIIRVLFKETTIQHVISKIMTSEEKTGEYIVLTDFKDRFPISYFADGEKVMFDGELMSVPTEWKKILIEKYDDYMTPPPEDKRFTAKMDGFIVEFPE